MEPRRRFAFTTGQKAILWIGVLLCLWQILTMPGVFDAILNFYAAGAIPGTDIVLKPDTILHFMVAALFSAAVVICYWKFGRRPPLDVQQAPLTGKKLQLYASFIETVRPVRRAQRTSWRIRSKVTWYADGVAHMLRAALEWLWPYAAYIGKLVLYVLVLAWRGFVHVVIWILAVESALFVWLWQWAEPRIRTFDKWLERKVNNNPYGARLVAGLSGLGEVLPKRDKETPQAARPTDESRPNGA